MRSAWLVLAVLLALPSVARADDPEQLVGLFIQGCLPFVGNPAALRDWAARTQLPPVPAQGGAAFLHGASGKVFDASAPGTKLVLVSADNGICSVVTNNLSQKQVVETLEAGLTKVGLRFRLVIERDDKQVTQIHDREYLATDNKVGWRILAATTHGEDNGEAMLTAAPE